MTYQAAYGRDLTITADGAGKDQAVAWHWNAVTQTFPYDVPGALRFLGARVAPFACGTGGGNYGDEHTTAYRVELGGTVPFQLMVGGRDSGSGGESAYWAVTVHPGAPVPGYAALVARMKADPESQDIEWMPNCPA